MTPEQMVSRVLYRDGLMLVIDKPAGFAVHRGPKGSESLEDHFDALRFGLPRAPALAHLIERDRRERRMAGGRAVAGGLARGRVDDDDGHRRTRAARLPLRSPLVARHCRAVSRPRVCRCA